MLSESLTSQVETQFPAGRIPQVPVQQAKRPRKKRLRSIFKHPRNASTEIARANSDRNRKVYERVFATYVELRGTAPIGACNIDPTGRRNGLSFSGIEFMADVDRCVAATLGSHCGKFYSLVQIELGEGSKTIATAGFTQMVFWRMVQRLGRSFDRRGLDPLTYFKTIRRKKCNEQPRATNTQAGTADEIGSAAKVRHSTDFDATDFESGYQFGRIESGSYE